MLERNLAVVCNRNLVLAFVCVLASCGTSDNSGDPIPDGGDVSGDVSGDVVDVGDDAAADTTVDEGADASDFGPDAEIRDVGPDDDTSTDADAGDSDVDGVDTDVDAGDSSDTDVTPPTPNVCGGFEALTYDGVAAAIGDSCGAFDTGALRCGNPNTLVCEDNAAVNSCGGLEVLPVEPGVACGCGGVFACTGESEVSCVGGVDRNACGGCEPIEGSPGAACETSLGTGIYTCDGADSIVCNRTATNACGGTGPLLYDGEEGSLPGEACTATCGEGQLVCYPDDTLFCITIEVCNACGGRSALRAVPESPCGPCGSGSWQCDGTDDVLCNDVAPTNVCGGCEPLVGAIGDACSVSVAGTSYDGALACGGGGLVCFASDAPDQNVCGGLGPLVVPDGFDDAPDSIVLGAACGDCLAGRWVCDGSNLVACQSGPGATRNACGGCATLSGAPGTGCGACGDGETVCDGTEAVECDESEADGLNVCGGCGATPGTLGELCGTCLEWTCDGTRMRCGPVDDLTCTGVDTCAELDCVGRNRFCTETDGRVDATCDGCFAGYEQAGAACVPVDCGALDAPVDGAVVAASTDYLSTATYSCNDGRVLVGSDTRTCGATGAWSGSAPICEPVAWLGERCVRSEDCPTNSICFDDGPVETQRCAPVAGAASDAPIPFVFAPGGTFVQGSEGIVGEERAFLSTITRDYFVSLHEVTQAQWTSLTGGVNPSCNQTVFGEACATDNANPSGPVENMDWYSALAFANAVSARDGLETCYTLLPETCADEISDWSDGTVGCTSVTMVGPSCTGYRILTESEHERAHRAGTTTTYTWGTSRDQATALLYGWANFVEGARSKPVGRLFANALGLRDMGGNVWEWTSDYYSAEMPVGAAVDYTGPVTPGRNTFRGGSWYNPVEAMRPAARNSFNPGVRSALVGMRLGRTVAPTREARCAAPDASADTRVIVSAFYPGGVATYTCTGGSLLVGDATRTCLDTGTWSGSAPTCEATNLGDSCTSDADCTGLSRCAINANPALQVCAPQVFGDTEAEMNFVLIPAGTFTQGTPGAVNEERPFESTITRSFFMAEFEVTQEQWRALSGGPNPACFQNPTGPCGGSNSAPSAPIERVSWWAALNYANQLSIAEGLTPCYALSSGACSDWATGAPACAAVVFSGLDCEGYRLPTESEFERASRGGSTDPYYWGTDGSVSTASLYAYFSNNAGGRTNPVGQLLPNAYGLYDIAGNVWEWVYDYYVPAYPEGAANDYFATTGVSGNAIRGGSWYNPVAAMRSSARNALANWQQSDAIGFRVVRTVP
jgi:formylglycine-generating enzyme required for sulfatase activity